MERDKCLWSLTGNLRTLIATDVFVVASRPFFKFWKHSGFWILNALVFQHPLVAQGVGTCSAEVFEEGECLCPVVRASRYVCCPGRRLYDVSHESFDWRSAAKLPNMIPNHTCKIDANASDYAYFR